MLLGIFQHHFGSEQFPCLKHRGTSMVLNVQVVSMENTLIRQNLESQFIKQPQMEPGVKAGSDEKSVGVWPF